MFVVGFSLGRGDVEERRSSCPSSLSGLKPLSSASVENGYCAFTFVDGLKRPRGMIIEGDKMLVIERGKQGILSINLTATKNQNDFTPDVKLSLFRGHSLNHGIAYDSANGFLYASSTTSVYRWEYDLDDHSSLVGTGQVVVQGIPSGGHSTRTLLFSDPNTLLVSIGSGSNVDTNNYRARLLSYDISDGSKFPYDWQEGTPIAVGLRNEVGIAMDRKNRIWGVENGVDNLVRSDFAQSDIHNDNPGEELNLFDPPGQDYGYPYCWSEFDLTTYDPSVARGPTTQWAQPGFSNISDEWCRDNIVPPRHVFQAHMAPLGLTFVKDDFGASDWRAGNEDEYEGEEVGFIAFHGSWNRNPAVGYRIERFVVDENDQIDSSPFITHQGNSASARSWPRPVNVAVGPCYYFEKCLFFTDDTGGRIIAIGKKP